MRASMLLCAALLSAGCALQMDVPEGFLRLRGREAGDVRAVTADDARIWVRDFAVDQGASLDFWVQSLRADLEQARGYRLAPESVDVQDHAGHRGKRIEGTIATGGEVRGYLVAVFQLDDQHLRVAEFAARQDVFARHVDAVRTAVTTVR